MKKAGKLLIGLFIVILITGCNGASSEGQGNGELTIAAAAGLTLAFTEIGELFEEETGIKVTFSFGSSGQLADQIEHGAPFDIFAAANTSFIENLDEKNLIITDTKQIYALGRIGLATRKDSSIAVEQIEDLLKPEIVKVAIANPEHAPYGLAAQQALKAAGGWEEVKGKLVFGRNISDTLSFVETGNAEVAIIARSLVREEAINFSLIDEAMHEPIEQMLAVIQSTRNEAAAKEFINFIFGPVGKPIMERNGYTIPTE